MCCCQCMNTSSPCFTPHSHYGKACKNRHFHCFHHKRKHVKLLQFWIYIKRRHSSCWVPEWNTDLLVRATPAAPTCRPRSRRICECLLADAFLPWKDPPCGICKVFSVDEQPDTLEGSFLLWHSKNRYHLEILVYFEKSIIITVSSIPHKSLQLVSILSPPLSVCTAAAAHSFS